MNPRVRVLVLLVAAAILSARCGGRPAPTGPTASAPVRVTQLTVVPPETMHPGDEAHLTAVASYSDGTSRTISDDILWESADPTVAVVSPSGTIKALMPGHVEIKGTYAGVTGRAEVSIEESAKPRPALFTVSGRVTDAEKGIALAGARIELKDFDNAVWTGADGAYTLQGVRAGRYVVRGMLAGYEVSEPSIEVSADTTLSMALSRPPRAPSPAPMPPSPPPALPPAPIPGPPLGLTVELSQYWLNVGESGTMTVRLQNQSPSRIDLHFASGCQILPYIVESGTGRVVYPFGGGWGCPAIITTLSLAPGESKRETFNVRAATYPPPFGLGAWLPPGDYNVYATLVDGTYKLKTGLIPLRIR